VYKDRAAHDVLVGSKVCPIDHVIVVKTHAPSNSSRHRYKCSNEWLDFRKSIYILRNPYMSSIAEFNRLHANKISVVDRAAFEKKGKCVRVYLYTCYQCICYMNHYITHM